MNSDEINQMNKFMNNKSWIFETVCYTPYPKNKLSDKIPYVEINGVNFIFEVQLPINDGKLQIIIDDEIIKKHSLSEKTLRFNAYKNTKRKYDMQIIPLGSNIGHYKTMYDEIKDTESFKSMIEFNLINSDECIMMGSKDFNNIEPALSVIEFFDKIALIYCEPFYMVVNEPAIMTAYPESTTNIRQLFGELNAMDKNPYNDEIFYYKDGCVKTITSNDI